MRADYLGMLRSGYALVSELPKLPKAPFDSKDSARTSENPQTEPRLTPSDTVAHWRLPVGREVWMSPAETQAEIEVRHPGAIPLPDSVTVTEPTSAEEAAAIAYAEKIQAVREQGRVPGSYTAITHCRHCGTVPIFAGAPARVDACPWCSNRTKGLPIPRPSVSCATCQHFTPDPIGHGGIGSCAAGGPPQGQMPAYPYAKRKCGDFEPKETAQ